MTILRTTILILLLNISCATFGQTGADTIKKKNYCSWTGCKLKPDDPFHFDPYYNGHLCENFNPEQIDFSKEYFQLRTKNFGENHKLSDITQYNFSQIWLTGDSEQNGVLGLNYQRIQFHIDKVTKSKKKSDTYAVSGKSKVNNNISNFKGELKLLKVFYFDSCDDTTKKKCGELFAEYIFYEDSSLSHSGTFKGITDCSFYFDSLGKQILLDDTFSGADGYWNRTFIGTWTDYKTIKAKKCIWGDDRLPFTFDFDIGDGEMHINDKYKDNGWQTFNDNSEINVLSNGQAELKYKWWKTIPK